MSWEQEDSLRRKVREARERRAFKDSIESVLSAKEAQGAMRTQREVDQGQLRQDKAERSKQPPGQGVQKNNSRIIRHVRDGRPERER
ncbi:hypothetical protein [Acidisoma cladoniae]|uniref:hypothetical protein n=1 Tax=Acidisoma cladoniae TaxID=3040935 RepID=UPI00254D82B4|nr:hypothetical protein [Acidisoma sp. PAMC 29798]